MVSPSPELQRRMNNTENIVIAKKAHLVPGLFVKYPEDYLELTAHENLKIKKPWVELIPKEHILKSQSSTVTGGDKVLIICVDFSDKPHSIPISTIYNR